MSTLLDRILKLEAARAARQARIKSMSRQDIGHRALYLYTKGHPRVRAILDNARERMHAAEFSDLA